MAGLFDGQTIHLVASNIEQGQGAALLGHESFHLFLKALKFNDSPQYKKLMTRLRNMERILGKGEGSRWFKEAHARIPEADRMNEATRLNELAAYAIEQYESAPRTLPEAMAKWVQDFIADVKAWLHDKAGGELQEHDGSGLVGDGAAVFEGTGGM